ncbi:DEAD/DEAH box helicase [Gordonia sp. HNM0687]|uniref:DEAD/DEAH box helicase n=1 Tax=Gordonia mangrovi TaxID=2665643 RepID=A0A6L7GWF5_9ACTN|nr:DEAD/DEAH box helicase [Gordonia mangrovi]MXP24329.1 DEAD/DEAH box helicase [Gordonia mangrovi]UVF80006.1 DEAD/DEAH box helicase [Gordonia mangrovi]
MGRDDRARIKALAHTASELIKQAEELRKVRRQVGELGAAADAELRQRVVDLEFDSEQIKVLPLRPGDVDLLASIEKARQLRMLSASDRSLIDSLSPDVERAVDDARGSVGARRIFMSKEKREAGRQAGEFLERYLEWAEVEKVSDRLPSLIVTATESSSLGDVRSAFTDWLSKPREIRAWGDVTVIDGAPATGLGSAVTTIKRVADAENQARADALEAGNTVRHVETEKLISDMPVERLKDATRDRLRVNALTDAGITTVAQVMEHGEVLEGLPGVGQTTATRMRGAAQTLWQTTYEEMPVRIDINSRTSHGTNLLKALGSWRALRAGQPTARETELLQPMAALAASALDTPLLLAVFAKRDSYTADHLVQDMHAVKTRAQSISAATNTVTDPWDGFMEHPADYFALLSELGLLTEDENSIFGDLPTEVIEAVRQQELDGKHLRASLRGYQSFGARFALVQKKVIIGDEMGLGKTIESIAVLTHLRARGSHHALVICPAAVVTNWMREVAAKSTLRPHRLHGSQRESALRQWSRTGGVAVTTFETLAWLSSEDFSTDGIGCVIVDEAHYIKNPHAQRSLRTVKIINDLPRAMLLTGTPLENRLDEFRNLVEYVRPDLAIDATELSPRRFRQQVAPAYLRRNQEDVLTELPELVEVEEWLPLSAEDMNAYRAAVSEGNFMAMRQAAMTQGKKSQKMARLLDLIEEAESNERRVIVFSHFRSVLDEVVRALPGKVFGPLTGSVPAARRQEMVDKFSAAGHGAVLVSQIVAGGVGLNIQAASVVVICEPQLKPTTEWQAIARARRMGQLESVQVHRLLTEEGVDLRVTEILARKRELFEDFARVSDIADSAPEAVDISEAELAREVIAEERERLFTKERSARDAVV